MYSRTKGKNFWIKYTFFSQFSNLSKKTADIYIRCEIHPISIGGGMNLKKTEYMTIDYLLKEWRIYYGYRNF